MILTKDQLTNICTEIDKEDYVYECILTKQKFAHALLKEQTSPLGNVISFRAQTKLGPLFVKDSLVICGELLQTNLFGGVCFQRLFSAQIGTILSDICQKDFYVDNNCLVAEDKQATITLINKVKDDIVFHIIFPLECEYGELHQLKLSEEQQTDFQTKVIDCFYDLTKSVFLETQSDNI